MTSHALTAIGFAAILIVAVVMELAARAGRLRIPTADQAFGTVMRRPVGRVIVFSLWFWFGWHFLAR